VFVRGVWYIKWEGYKEWTQEVNKRRKGRKKSRCGKFKTVGGIPSKGIVTPGGNNEKKDQNTETTQTGKEKKGPKS